MISNLPILCFSGQHVSELHMYHFYFFSICAFTCFTCSFVVFASAAVAHEIIVLLKKSISYFMDIMYKHIFLKFGVISFINKEMVSLFQLHTYKFGLVYIETRDSVLFLRSGKQRRRTG